MGTAGTSPAAEKGGNPELPPLLGPGLGIPTPGTVSQASHVSAVRESLSIKSPPAQDRVRV